MKTTKKSVFLSVSIASIFCGIVLAGVPLSGVFSHSEKPLLPTKSIKFNSKLVEKVIGHSVTPKKTALSEDGELKSIKKRAKLFELASKIPLSFVKNNGQVDKNVEFYEKGIGHSTFFTRDGVYISLIKREKLKENKKTGNAKQQQALSEAIEAQGKSIKGKRKAQIVKLTPLGINKNHKITSEGMKRGRVNYFKGNEPSKWKTNIPAYKAVVYNDIYRDVDMKFYGNNKQLEYDIIVKPGADLSDVKFSYDGIKNLKVTDKGELEISLKNGKLIQKKPYIYQEINGKRVEINGKFKLLTDSSGALKRALAGKSGKFAYSFEVASYDKNHTLVIDPVLSYSSYLGGSMDDYAYAIAVDNLGNAYITGQTYSYDFPLASAMQGAIAGSSDVFVTKFDTSGSFLSYSTYLGGESWENGNGIALDRLGNAYVTGITHSYDFPVSPASGNAYAPFQRNNAGGSDAFIAKLDASGASLEYSTYIGGSSWESGNSIALDRLGNAYVAGNTHSYDFPVSPASGNAYAPFQRDNAGSSDVFVTKLNRWGSSLHYSTYLGGSDWDIGRSIALDASGNAYVTGSTASYDFPTTHNAFQEENSGNSDVFVTKLNFRGSSLAYSTYIGGSYGEIGNGIALDASGNAYITGNTSSYDFPTTRSAFQEENAGSSDAFVARLNPRGSSLAYSTYLGGDYYDSASAITLDALGDVYITGRTDSYNFPTTSDSIQVSNAGNSDSFITRFDASGIFLAYSTYIGGSDEDSARGIALDASGNAYVTGYTHSYDFLAPDDALGKGSSADNNSYPGELSVQGSNFGEYDAFAVKVSFDNFCSNHINLSCNRSTYSGNTGRRLNRASRYSCDTRLSETGPEVVHTFTTTAAGNLTANISGLDSDLDVIILSSCDPDSCVALGNNTAIYENAPAGTYYIVVDGHNGAKGNYTLNVDGNCSHMSSELQINATEFREGEEIVAEILASNHTNNDIVVDAVLEIVLPDSSTLTLDSISGATIPRSMAHYSHVLYERVFTGTEPEGTYTMRLTIRRSLDHSILSVNEVDFDFIR